MNPSSPPLPPPSLLPAPSLRWERVFVVALVLLGTALRMRAYLHARSFWVDELSLALNLEARSFLELTRPLDYDQGAPIPFLWATKACLALFGRSELSLRLVPLLTGIALLPFVHAVTRRLFGAGPAILALLLAAVSEPLVRFSTELKPYGPDAFVAIAFVALALPLLEGSTSRRRIGAVAAAGVGAIVGSFPAAFVVASVGLCWLLARRRTGLRGLLPCFVVGAVWVLTLFAHDRLVLAHLRGSHALVGFHTPFFAPFPPRDGADLRWYADAAAEFTRRPLGLRWPFVALPFLAVGVAVAAARRRVALVLLLPTLFALAASALHVYPFTARLLVFAGPLTLPILCAATCLPVPSPPIAHVARAACIAACAVLAAPTLARAGHLAREPFELEETRGLLAELSERVKSGDAVFVYRGGRKAVAWYVPSLRSRDGVALVDGETFGLDDARAQAEVARVPPAPRTWVFLAHVRGIDGRDEAVLLRAFARRLGSAAQATVAEGASLHRFAGP